jgi:ketosteroid isomerase-like protein
VELRRQSSGHYPDVIDKASRRAERRTARRDTARAMSQENIETVRAGLTAWNAGDMDAVRDFYDPTVVVRAAEGWPEPGPAVGLEEVMRQWEQMRDAFDFDTLEPISDFIDVGDRVAVRQSWRGVGHGPVSTLELTSVYTVRSGKVVYQEFFWDHAEALEAVGLSKQDAHADS